MFACGCSGVRVAAFFEKLAHFLAFVVKVGVVTAEASESEKLKELEGIFHLLWMRGHANVASRYKSQLVCRG